LGVYETQNGLGRWTNSKGLNRNKVEVRTT